MKTLLIQTQVSGSFDGVTVAMWAIGGMLALIAVLISAIWQDTKRQSEAKHADLVGLIDKLDKRQEKIEERQDKTDRRMSRHAWRMVAMNTAISMIQGKPFDFDIPADDEEDE